MASLSSPSFTLVSLALILSLAPALRTLMAHMDPDSGFSLTLRRRGSATNPTKFQRINQSIKATSQRLLSKSSGLLSTRAAIRPDEGLFLVSLSIGTPPVAFTAILDTGTDLTWTQCEPCSHCVNMSSAPLFNPKGSSSYALVPCWDQRCEAMPMSSCGATDRCEYMYIYEDDSTTEGVLATETFTFGNKASLEAVTFGCGQINHGDRFKDGAGVLGLGRGLLSFVSKLDDRKFSYCLPSIDGGASGGGGGGSVFFGSLASSVMSNISMRNGGTNLKTTALVKNPNDPTSYYLALQGISVGGKRLPIQRSAFDLREDGTGGVVLDTGAPITFLEPTPFKAVALEFAKQVNLTRVDSASVPTELRFCFGVPRGAPEKSVPVPEIVFHFEGADLVLARESCVVEDSEYLCLAMETSPVDYSVFGNFQQQNMMVLHDLEAQTVSFLPTPCDKV